MSTARTVIATLERGPRPAPTRVVAAGDEGQAHAGQHGEQRRGAPRSEPADRREVAGGPVLHGQHVGRGHADERQPARQVHADDPAACGALRDGNLGDGRLGHVSRPCPEASDT